MKKIISFLLIVFCISTIQAQKTDSDSKLLVKYSKRKLAKLKKRNPKQYNFSKFCVSNAFYVAALSREKLANNPKEYGEIEIKDINNINFFELNIELKKSESQAFVIKGTEKLLMVKSVDFINYQLNKK